MTMYNYTESPVSVGTLTSEIQAESGITTPLVCMTFREPDDLEITFSGSLSAGEQTLLDAVVSGHGGQFPMEPANLPSGDYESGMFIVTDGAGRTKWVEGFESTVSGVDPIEEYDIATKGYIDSGLEGFSTQYQYAFFKDPANPWANVASTTYFVINRIAYLGSNATPISHIVLTAGGSHASSESEGNLQLYDVTNNNQIAEVTVSGLVSDPWQIFTWDNAISNLPTGLSHFEIRVRYIPGTRAWRINNLILY